MKENATRKALSVLGAVLGAAIVGLIAINRWNARDLTVGAAFGVIMWELLRGEEE